jgi:predicted O-methyltransferase YrrM
VHTILQYFWYWLTAVNDHSLQSPFIYDFYNKVLKSKKVNEDILPIESLRQELQQSKEQIAVIHYGAPSRVNNRQVRPVSKIARGGVTTAKTSQLLNRIIHVYGLNKIVELGTSFGLNTMYLAMEPDRSVTTFEGCSNTLNIARQNFIQLDYSNITTIEGNIDDTLPKFIAAHDEYIDFAYLDANHRLTPTLNYFDLLYSKANRNTIMVLDDIHWSSEMSKAWKIISADPRVTLSIDLFDLGIVFFRQELKKQHYSLRY